MTRLLVADIGGTKSRLALFDQGSRSSDLRALVVYQNCDFPSFESILENYLNRESCACDAACLGVAGVVDRQKVEMTNLPWIINGKALARRYNWSEIFIINDMTALTQGLAVLDPHFCHLLKDGEKISGETRAVIAPGTGLGQGYLVPHRGGFICKCSEGGHSGFSPTSGEELELAAWLMEKTGFATAEQVCAGSGISTLFDFYLEQGRLKPLESIEEAVRTAEDRSPVIVAGATAEQGCPLCLKVVETFLRTLGRESANQALKLYARGGVFIGGGLVSHLLGKVSFTPFIDGFHHNDKMKDFLRTIPVYIIKDKDVNLRGALAYGQARMVS